jgi:hypothetical protein
VQLQTAEEWWELLDKAPKVAGPWEEYHTEEQRVRTMMVRRLTRIMSREIVVNVHGPHFEVGDYSRKDENRKDWIAGLHQGYEQNQLWYTGEGGHYGSVFCKALGKGSFPSMEEAMAGADQRLAEEGWLLVGGIYAPRLTPESVKQALESGAKDSVEVAESLRDTFMVDPSKPFGD